MRWRIEQDAPGRWFPGLAYLYVECSFQPFQPRFEAWEPVAVYGSINEAKEAARATNALAIGCGFGGAQGVYR